jgi:succinyl-CoA synthetase beta subunit
VDQHRARGCWFTTRHLVKASLLGRSVFLRSPRFYRWFRPAHRAPQCFAGYTLPLKIETQRGRNVVARSVIHRWRIGTPMKIHEFQAKQVLAKFGVAVPQGRECSSAAEAEAAHTALGTPVTVVKAQIHAGGRGKAGGVKVVKSAAEAKAAAEEILGKTLITPQTGPGGQLVRRLWVEEGSDIASEYYIGIAIDREEQKPVMMASSEGGMEIEEVAEHSPEKILKAPFSPAAGLAMADAVRLAEGIGLNGDLVAKAAELMIKLSKAFTELDCSIAEINPLVTTKGGDVLALDAKIGFDDNALFRHKEILALRDLDEEDPKEIEAAKFDLSYIALDGNIGCMVNGAGLAMATMDVIQLHGGEPANFLDVGGGATKENVKAAFKILLSDPNVKGVLVNIFGGIMRCDVIAEGVCAAVEEIDLNIPLVVRLEGTNVEKGREILNKSGLPLESASNLDDAAAKICKSLKS